MFEELDHYQSMADTVVVLVNLVVIVAIAGAIVYFVKQYFDNSNGGDDSG
jgi:uncharacterized protein involved in cysteine biosynthesis